MSENASKRILTPRKFASGHENSLQNTSGKTLLNGAQCFVLSEESNYRFLGESELHPDGQYVVAPVDGQGRWVREGGLAGHALLQDGKVAEDGVTFAGYQKQLLVQFSASPDGWVIYTGKPPRFGFLHGFASDGAPGVGLLVHRASGAQEPFPGGHNSVQASLILQQGDRVCLMAAAVPSVPVSGGLHIVLQ